MPAGFHHLMGYLSLFQASALEKCLWFNASNKRKCAVADHASVGFYQKTAHPIADTS